MKNILKVGDEVAWKNAWGTDSPRLAKVTRIEIVPPGEKEGGEEVNTVPWAVVEAGAVVVDLDNHHWAYGYQISPVSTKETTDQVLA